MPLTWPARPRARPPGVARPRRRRSRRRRGRGRSLPPRRRVRGRGPGSSVARRRRLRRRRRGTDRPCRGLAAPDPRASSSAHARRPGVSSIALHRRTSSMESPPSSLSPAQRARPTPIVVGLGSIVVPSRAKSSRHAHSHFSSVRRRWPRLRRRSSTREVLAARAKSFPSVRRLRIRLRRRFHHARRPSAARNVFGSASLVARPSSIVAGAISVDRYCRFHQRPLAPDVIPSPGNVAGGAHTLILSPRNVAGGAHRLIGRRATSSDLARRRRGRPHRCGEPRPSSRGASPSSLPAPPMPWVGAQRLRIRLHCHRSCLHRRRSRIPRRRTWRDVVASRATSFARA